MNADEVYTGTSKLSGGLARLVVQKNLTGTYTVQYTTNDGRTFEVTTADEVRAVSLATTRLGQLFTEGGR